MDIDIILEPDVTPAQITELGLLAEQSGINRLWVQNYAQARDVFMSVVPLAMASKRINIGVMVVSPWGMHPLKMANALLTLNEYCGGRATLCVGGGGEWNAVMDIPVERRVRAVREAAEERGFHVIDSHPYFLGSLMSHATSYWILPADSHPNAEGHALLGEALWDGLEELPDECWKRRRRG